MPAGPSTEMWTKTSFPPSSLATKPKPLTPSNHLTLPVTGTAVEGSGRGAAGPRRVARERPLRALDDAGGVDFDHASHLRAFGPGADLNLQFGARGNRLVAGAMQRIGVEERIALASGQLDKAVSLVGLEPFHDRIDRRSVRIDWRRSVRLRTARRRSRPPERPR